jgi:hypothetical protein
MTEYPQLKAIPDPNDAHERNLADEAGQARARIEELTARLRGLDEEIENLLTTRKTLRALPDPPGAETPAQPEVPEHPVGCQRSRMPCDLGVRRPVVMLVRLCCGTRG